MVETEQGFYFVPQHVTDIGAMHRIDHEVRWRKGQSCQMLFGHNHYDSHFCQLLLLLGLSVRVIVRHRNLTRHSHWDHVWSDHPVKGHAHGNAYERLPIRPHKTAQYE